MLATLVFAHGAFLAVGGALNKHPAFARVPISPNTIAGHVVALLTKGEGKFVRGERRTQNGNKSRLMAGTNSFPGRISFRQ
jgi:hypothetical protein